MRVTPLVCWDFIHPGALAWSADRTPVACDVPHGVELRVEPAAKSDPFLVMDRPWEERLGWVQVMADQGRYRLWYGVIRNGRQPRELLCYAESSDGRSWDKPELGLVEVDGEAANNVVFAGPGAVHFCVLRCPDENGDGSYRCIVFKSWWEGAAGEELDNEEGLRRLEAKNAAGPGEDVLPVTLQGKMLGMKSRDGIRWRPLARPILDSWHDTHNICVYDWQAGLYRAYLRGFYGGRRAIAYSETVDFENWPPARIIHHQHAADRPDESLYSNCYTRYPGRNDLHLMFPSIYRQGTDTAYGQLAVSLDGVNWSRLTRQAIVPHGLPGSPDGGMVFPEPELLRFPREGRFRQPCRCSREYHNEGYNPVLAENQDPGFCCWAEWPEDRLAGIAAPADGEFTIAAQPCGDRLLANLRTAPDGWVRFELVDRLVWPPQQTPGIQGCLFEDGEPITGDHTHAQVRWRGSPDLSQLRGRNVAIRVRLYKSELFAVTMYGSDEPAVQADPRFPV